MRVYAVFPNYNGTNKNVKISGPGVVGTKMVSENIVRKLGIDLESNLAKIIINLSEIRINFPAGYSIISFVAKKRYVDIFMYLPMQIQIMQNLTKIKLAQFDGGQENPERLKHAVVDAVVASINCMGLSTESQRGFLGRLKKMKEPFVCY